VNYSFWQGHYGGAVDIVGKPITLDHRAYTIIGVSAPEFAGVRVGQSFDVATTLCAAPNLDDSASSSLRFMGRLKPDIPMSEAEADLRSLQPAIRDITMPVGVSASFAKTYLRDPFTLVPSATGSSTFRDNYSRALIVLMSVVGLVLLVACGNIASLLLARATARTREIAVRVSIGASRFRLIRQLLVESLVLSLSASILGIFLARLSAQLLVRQLSTGTAKVFLDLTLDWHVLTFTIGVGSLAGLLFGIIPAIRATRWNSTDTLREMTALTTAAGRRVGSGRWLVSFQMGSSLVLIFVATLFLRSYWKLATTDHGFKATNVLLIDTSGRGSGIADPVKRMAAYNEMLASVRVLPGVQSAAYSVTIPLGDTSISYGIQVEGFHPQSERDSEVYFNYLSPDYFATYGTALIAGRDLDPHDALNPNSIAIVNEAFARRFFEGKNPVGRTFSRNAKDGPRTVEIVGFVKDASYYSLRETVPPTVYMPVSPLAAGLTFSVRSTGTAEAIASSVVRTIGNIDETTAITVRTFQSRVDDSMVQDRLMAVLSVFFGSLALIIASVGLAGLVGYSVNRRRAEIGLRSALGATPASVVLLIMRDVIALTTAGLISGSFVSIAGARLIGAMLYEVTPADPVTLAIAVATLAFVAILTGYIPARRAAHIDPMECLRSE
jgi:predicted permease